MGSIAASALFTPIQVGNVQLKHRVAFAPCTRVRSTSGTHIPILPLVKDYYEQRASVPGTLLITEATLIAEQAGGMDCVPGIYSEEQIKAWKEVTDVVHSKGSFVFSQLWALGRAARPQNLQGHPYVSASPIGLSTSPADMPAPRELTIEEIKQYVELYGTAAKNAIEAGFDGVEIHAANGYLIDQFLQDVSNKRTDEYGGSIENRSKFGLEVVDAVVKAVGAERTALRFSPWSTYQDMKMSDPIPTFDYFTDVLAKKYPNLAYIHFVEPTVSGGTNVVPAEGETNDSFRKIWGPRPFISCGDFTRVRAMEQAEKTGDIIAFGRAFISNPDLPFRLQENVDLTEPDFSTFYWGGEKGYTDYAFSSEFTAKQS